MTRHPELVVQAVLGTSPSLSHVGEERRPFCRFRAATTPSLRTADGRWRDGETLWLTVKAWGALAENLAFSLHKGEPVLLHGRLAQETWTGEHGESTSSVLTLISAGHDLTRGLSRFARSGAPASSASSAPSASSPDAVGAPAACGEDASVVLGDEHWRTPSEDEQEGSEGPAYVLADDLATVPSDVPGSADEAGAGSRTGAGDEG